MSCRLVPWLDEVGEAQACELTCRVDEDVYAVMYLQGVYVLGCRPKPDTRVVTPAPTSAPTPVAASAGAPIAAIAGGVAGGVGLLVFVACLIHFKSKPSEEA